MNSSEIADGIMEYERRKREIEDRLWSDISEKDDGQVKTSWKVIFVVVGILMWCLFATAVEIFKQREKFCSACSHPVEMWNCMQCVMEDQL